MILVGVFATPAYAAEYQIYLGATLPKWAKKIGEHRFRSPWDWHTTMRWVRKTYPNRVEYPRIRIVNQPGIKAIHLKNARRHGDWEGMNIYELEGGEVRIYVLPRQASNASPKGARSALMPRRHPAGTTRRLEARTTPRPGVAERDSRARPGVFCRGTLRQGTLGSWGIV
ncbi:MAG: hypothetical protein D6729_03040 [Deltaproteobacteria bacterium]|nr:MAG: hypothetical protein D6729_03040 [Deltaproteobacteria bacterium]